MVDVGQVFTRIDGPVTREQIKKYGKASGDMNPIHMDEEFATTRGGLSGVIAHGMLFMGFVSHLLSDIAEEEKGKFLDLQCEMRGMVRPGDTVVTNATVKSIEGGIMTLEVIQNSEMPLKLEKDGAVVETYEGEKRSWVKEKEKGGIKTKEIDGGTLTYREWLAIRASAKVKLP
jgi:acyl dehydratase